MENKLYHIAKTAERFQIANSNEPTRSALSEEDNDRVDGFTEKIKWLREINSESIMDGGVLATDILFSSPSSAADFVTGNKCNGLEYWKTENGKTLKQLETKVTATNN
jgi:hypothetical protein